MLHLQPACEPPDISAQTAGMASPAALALFPSFQAPTSLKQGVIGETLLKVSTHTLAQELAWLQAIGRLRLLLGHQRRKADTSTDKHHR